MLVLNKWYIDSKVFFFKLILYILPTVYLVGYIMKHLIVDLMFELDIIYKFKFSVKLKWRMERKRAENVCQRVSINRDSMFDSI